MLILVRCYFLSEIMDLIVSFFLSCSRKAWENSEGDRNVTKLNMGNFKTCIEAKNQVSFYETGHAPETFSKIAIDVSSLKIYFGFAFSIPHIVTSI